MSMGKLIESEKTLIKRPSQDIFSFLGDFNNFSHLIPEQVANWKSSSDHCSFEIKGLTTMGMQIINREPFTKIVMKSEGRTPINFILTSHIEILDDSASNVQFSMDTDMNSFLAMVAETPLSNFINLLVGQLKKVMEENQDK
jgi:hypothetical protein